MAWAKMLKLSNLSLQAQSPRHDDRLDQHARRDLGDALPPLDEDDRDLTDAAAEALGQVERLDEECITVGDYTVERYFRQRFPAPASIARRAIVRIEARHHPDVPIRKRAQDDSPQRPIHHADAIQVARSDHEIGRS